MRPRRVPGLTRAVALGILGLFAACTFPSVSYDQGDGGAGAEGGPDATRDGASSSGSGGHDGSLDGTGGEGGGEGSLADGTSSGGDDSSGSSSGDSALSDVGIEDAPDEYVFEASPDAPDCDKDQDGYLSSAGGCGGNDCCDTDPRANPGDTAYYDSADLCGTFDYNCSGTDDPQYATSFSCGALNTGACAGASGFKDSPGPGCGSQSPNFITCKVSTAILCVVDTTTTVTQGCK